jgi:hypothetical protein
MGRGLASAMASAAAVLALSACGGGSSGATSSATNPTTSTSADTGTIGRIASSGTGEVAALHGGFRTVIPHGYSNGLSAAGGGTSDVEYMAIGPRVGGKGAVLTVFRASAVNGDVAALARRAMRQLARRPAFLPKPRRLSPLQKLTIDGEPAVAVDYQLVKRSTNDRRQLFVIHGGWAYEISDAAAPDRFGASLHALDEVISGWRWQ